MYIHKGKEGVREMRKATVNMKHDMTQREEAGERKRKERGR